MILSDICKTIYSVATTIYSVGAGADDVVWGGPSWPPAGWGGGRVPPTCTRDEQDAGDHKGPPSLTQPRSPLRMLMGFLL